jgi:hypothetical protein
MTRSRYEVIERIITPRHVPLEHRWRVAMTIAARSKLLARNGFPDVSNT